MQIIYGLGASTVFSKAEANKSYEETKRIRLSVEKVIKAAGAAAPQQTKDYFYEIDKWFWPNYEAFLKASEISYGNWVEAAKRASSQYNDVLAGLTEYLEEKRKPQAPGTPPPGGAAAPIDPAVMAGIIIAAAAIVGLLLAPKAPEPPKA